MGLYERNNQERKFNGNIVKLKICNLKKKRKAGLLENNIYRKISLQKRYRCPELCIAIASVNFTLEMFKGTVALRGLPHRLCTSTDFLQWGRTSSPLNLPSWCRCCWRSASPCESPARKQTSAEPLRVSKWRTQVSGKLNNLNGPKKQSAPPSHTHILSLPWAIGESVSSKNSDGQWEVLSIGNHNKNLGLIRMAEPSWLKQTRMKQPDWLYQPIYGSAATIKTYFADWLDRLPMPTVPSLFPGYWPICLSGSKLIKACGRHWSANGKNTETPATQLDPC